MKIYENGKFREMTEKEIQEIVNYIPEEDKGFTYSPKIWKR